MAQYDQFPGGGFVATKIASLVLMTRARDWDLRHREFRHSRERQRKLTLPSLNYFPVFDFAFSYSSVPENRA
jgi:hypothetical protein